MTHDNAGADGVDTLRNVETLRFLDGDVATSTFAVPAPAAQVQTPLAFGLRALGSTTNLPVVVTNSGNAPLTVTGATIATGTGFSVANNGCTTVAPAGTCTIQVAFAPGTSTAARSATLNIAHDAAGSPTSVSLTGQGQVAPAVQVQTTLAFGLRAIGSTTNLPLVVTNNGTAPTGRLRGHAHPGRRLGLHRPDERVHHGRPGGHLHHHGSLCPRQRDHGSHGNAAHRAQRCRFTRHGCPERSGAGCPAGHGHPGHGRLR